MKIGILSDTHNQLQRTQFAVEELLDEGAEVLIHCGDLATAEIVQACAQSVPFYFVLGNHDADNVPALTQAAEEYGAQCLGWCGELTLANVHIAICHGHLKTDRQTLNSRQPDIMLSGHSHIANHWMEDDVWRINPGALHRATEFTVALLDLTNDELTSIVIPR